MTGLLLQGAILSVFLLYVLFMSAAIIWLILSLIAYFDKRDLHPDARGELFKKIVMLFKTAIMVFFLVALLFALLHL